MIQQIVHNLLSLSDKNVPVLRVTELWMRKFGPAAGPDSRWQNIKLWNRGYGQRAKA